MSYCLESGHMSLKINHKWEFAIPFNNVWPSKWTKKFEQVKFEMVCPFWVRQHYYSLLRTYQKGESVKVLKSELQIGNSLLRTYVLKWFTFLTCTYLWVVRVYFLDPLFSFGTFLLVKRWFWKQISFKPYAIAILNNEKNWVWCINLCLTNFQINYKFVGK